MDIYKAIRQVFWKEIATGTLPGWAGAEPTDAVLEWNCDPAEAWDSLETVIKELDAAHREEIKTAKLEILSKLQKNVGGLNNDSYGAGDFYEMLSGMIDDLQLKEQKLEEVQNTEIPDWHE